MSLCFFAGPFFSRAVVFYRRARFGKPNNCRKGKRKKERKWLELNEKAIFVNFVLDLFFNPFFFFFFFYFKCLHFLSSFCRSLSLQYPLASLSLCLFCFFVFFAQLFFNKFLYFFFLFCFFSPCLCFILCLFFLFFLLALASLSTYSIVYLFPCLVCPFVSLLSNRSFFSHSWVPPF